MKGESPIKVLLIEDNPADANLIQDMLKSAPDPIEMEHVWQLSAGLERIETGDFDAILLDLTLPGSRGLKTFNTVHAHAPHLPTVVLSGMGDEALTVGAVRNGAQDYLVKGQVTRSLLIRAIRYAIERQRAERALRESETRYRCLIESSDDMIFSVDRDGIFRTAGGTRLSQFGLRPEDVMGRSIEDLFEQEASQYVERHRQVFESGEPLTFEHTLELAGLTRTYLTTVYPIKDENDEITTAGVISRDISEQKQAELEREQLLRQVQEQAHRIRKIMDTVPEGVFLVDPDRRVVLANPLGREHLKTLADAQVGDVITRLGDSPLTEFLVSPPQNLWHELSVAGGTFQVVAKPIEADPAPNGWVIVVRDVTHQREIDVRVQQQERLAALGQLVAGIAHDFNNILVVISLYASIGQRLPDLPPKLYNQLKTIDEQARRASDLIQQLMDFGRRTILERGPLDMVTLLNEQIKLLRRTLPETIRIDLTYNDNDYMADVDPTRLQQMIMNLATNARDAMPQGGELHMHLDRVSAEGTEGEALSRLALAQQRANDANPDTAESPAVEDLTREWIRLTVSDTGTGIPPEVVPHIFDPFYTTKPPGRGTGLGLSQVYGIVKQHGGYVDVATTVGEGTTFTIYLPALLQHRPQISRTVKEPADSGQGQTILVVEDEPATRLAVIDSLESLGYHALEARDGHEALAYFEEQEDGQDNGREGRNDQIALVLSDVVMPKMGGPALFKALRQRGTDTRVVLMSGHPLEEEELNILQSWNLNGWLPKPPSLEQLADVIAQALREA